MKLNTRPLDDNLFCSTQKAGKPIVSGILHPNVTLIDTAAVSHTYHKLLIFLLPTYALNHYTAKFQVWVFVYLSGVFNPQDKAH